MGVRERIEREQIKLAKAKKSINDMLKELDTMVEARKEEKLPCAEPLEIIAKILRTLV